MLRLAFTLLLLACLSALPIASAGQRPEGDKPSDPLALNSPSRLLKHQHEEVRKWSARLTELATEVEEELEKNGENVLPLSTLKKLEEIEKLARKMRGRIKQ